MEKIIFVYNADAGFFNMVTDIAHKIFSPATYPCSLCDLTYGVFKIRPEWEDFVKNAPVPFEFLHKDEFHKAFPQWSNVKLPVVLAEKSATRTLEVLISQTELDNLTSIESLKNLILDAAV